jgi:hypothetical protein
MPRGKSSLWDILTLANLTLQEVTFIQGRLRWLQRLVMSGHKSNGRRIRNLLRWLSSNPVLAKLAVHSVLKERTSTGLGADLYRSPWKTELVQIEHLCVASPRKRKWIPKPDGTLRGLAIPSLQDRIRERMMATILEIVSAPRQSTSSVGFRYNQDRHRGMSVLLNKAIKMYGTDGFNIIDTDFRKYFDTIPHAGLRTILRVLGVRGRAYKFLSSCLTAKIIDRTPVECPNTYEYMQQIGQPFIPVYEPLVGTPQGGVLSPLLANLYGERLDRELDRLNLPFLRYADNNLVAYPLNLEGKILAILQKALPKGIALHEGKTQYLKGHGMLTTLGCVIIRGGVGIRLLVCEGYKQQEAAPGREARLSRPWANIGYVQGALGWLRNLAIHFKHQLIENRSRWARHVGLRRVYLRAEDIPGVKPGVYREVRLMGPTGIKVSSRAEGLEVRGWSEGSLKRTSLTSEVDRQGRTLHRIGQWLRPLLSKRAVRLRDVRCLLKVSRLMGDTPMVELLTQLTAVYSRKSARFQQELHARMWATRVRETGEVDGLSPIVKRGLPSGVFLPIISEYPRQRYRKRARVSDQRVAQYRVDDWAALYGPLALEGWRNYGCYYP